MEERKSCTNRESSIDIYTLSSNTLAIWCEELTHLQRPWCWERLSAGGKGMTENEMVGWHHQLNGHGFGWTLGVGDGQGGLACCSSWGRKESDMTDWLNRTELHYIGKDSNREVFKISLQKLKIYRLQLLLFPFPNPNMFINISIHTYISIQANFLHPSAL